MKKKPKRILGILLTLCMILTMLPMTALADEDPSQIKVIEINDVTLPVGGDPSDAHFTVPSEALYEEYNDYSDFPKWTDKDDDSAVDSFVSGNTYRLHIKLKSTIEGEIIGDEYPFPLYADSLTVKINDEVIDSSKIVEYSAEYDRTVCYLIFEFTAEYPPVPKQLLTVLKKDGESKPLAGATFIMMPELKPGDEFAVPIYAKSNEEGEAKFELEDGTYTLWEESAPDGYIKSEDTYTIMVSENGVYITGLTPAPEPYSPVTFINYKEPEEPVKSIIVYKHDQDGEPLAGAEFIMQPVPQPGEAVTPTAIYSTLSDSKGEAKFENIDTDDRTYILSESKAPEGYEKSDDKYSVRISANGILIEKDDERYEEIIFVNTLISKPDPKPEPKPNPKPSGNTGKTVPVLVKDDHFAYMQGYPEGTFRPDNNITRAEAVAMFSRLLAKTMNLDKDYRDSHYTDVDSNAWYANQIGYMHSLGVLEDYTQGKNFRPDQAVTRAEFAVLAAQFDKLSLNGTNSFTDVPDDHWHVKYINSAADKGWINGYPDKTFKPDFNITRAEIVTLVNRILERNADKNYLETNSKALPHSYSDVSKNHWAYLDIMEASMGHDFQKNGKTEVWIKVYK